MQNNKKDKSCSTTGCSKCTKTRLIMLAILLVIVLLKLIETASAGEGTWPKTLQTPNGTLTLYQPQPESYNSEKGTIEAHAALSFKKTGDPAPKFGSILFTARYAVDRDTRTAQLQDITLKDWKFPDATEDQASKLQTFINNAIAKKSVTTSLDELIHSLKGANNKLKDESQLNNTPPKIIYREQPAALVVIDGKPIKKLIEGTNYERVINTPYMMLYDTTENSYYLNGNNSWFTTKNIHGKWIDAPRIPQGLDETAKAQGLEQLSDEVDKSSVNPEIIISEEPAELISVDGAPDYSQIDGAGLLYVKNSSSILILDISEQDYYTLISGRWFTSKSLADDAEWHYVDNNKVPDEFYNIPTNDKTSTIKAAIPNTNEANEAVLDASIPQTAEVQLDSPSPEINYDGKPRFENTGSSKITYAVNTSSSIIKVGNEYYLCEDAIWYKSTKPTGPWQVCTEIPAEIYSIPPECPVYNTTYVRIYDHTPQVVYVGYTPGYVGSYIYNGVVVYGTGYVYRPWYGTYYYPRPATWGFGVRYNPWTGRWGFGIGYRPYGGGGFVFGVGFGGGWYGHGRGGGWWGRGGYRDRNVTINNNITINNNRRRDNIYKGRDNVKTLQERRDNLTPSQKDARKDRINTRRDENKGLSSDKAKDRRQDRREDGNGLKNKASKENRQARREDGKGITSDKAKDRRQDRQNSGTKPTRDRVNNQPTRPTNDWKQSKRDNNVFSDKDGNVFRSNTSTNNWQQMNNKGKWSNAQPSKSTRQHLNTSRNNRQSGAARQRQSLQRNSTQRQRSNSAQRSRPSGSQRSGGSNSNRARSRRR